MGEGPTDEEIVKFAYCMAVGEQRYMELFASLKERFTQLVEQDEMAASDAQVHADILCELEALEDHFGNARSLLELSGRQRDSVPFSQKLIDASETPAALVDASGRVVVANDAAQNVLGFKTGSRVRSDIFEHGQHDNFLSNLRKIDQFPENKVISLFGLYVDDADTPVHMAMTRADTLNGEAVGYLTIAKINWLPEKSEQFQSLFKLTPSEIDITKGLVNGHSLGTIAEKRGRAVGTVRQQMKQLLAKLELRSQTELVCLYSGIVKFDGYVEPAQVPAKEAGDYAENERIAFSLSDGRRLDYELVGDPSHQPILFLPALLGGTVVTDAMRAELDRQGLRLIMPWRPLMGDSDSAGRAKLSRLADYARDIEVVLDNCGVDHIMVVGHITSAMWAYALGCHLPTRITKVANVNGIIPVNSGPHVKMLNPSERLRFYVHRHLPKVASMVTHSMLKVVDSGQDLEFLEVFLDKNPMDLETIREEEIQQRFRAMHDFITRAGFQAFSHEVSLAALDWQDMIEGLPCPLLNVVGEHNLSFTPEVLRCFEKDKRLDLRLRAIEGAGHLALYQKPNVVFGMLAEFLGQR